jgi:WXG100 family type VII secretion target
MIRVDFAALQNAVTSITDASNFMVGELATLEASVAAIAQPGGATESWSGAAQSEYQLRHTEWRAAAAALNDILADLAVRVDNAAHTYHNAEIINEQRFILRAG